MRNVEQYVIEAAGTAMLLIVAGLATLALWSPSSPLHAALPAGLPRRIAMGAIVGATVLGLVTSRWGMRSGAHFNPAVTFAFFGLGKIAGRDALAYALAQFCGALLGVGLIAVPFARALAHPSVAWYATVPGRFGAGAAFAGEALVSFVLFWTVLTFSNRPALAPYAGAAAATLVALAIAFEAPLSGTSLNPARTFATALGGGIWTAAWVYFTAPLLGMTLAAQLYRRLFGRDAVRCAKLQHPPAGEPCIFGCRGSAYERLDLTRPMPVRPRTP